MVESDYIRIMTESLVKKRDILEKVIELNKQQKFLLQDPNLSPEEFEENMQYKSNLVEQLNLLDSGFEKLFDRIRDEFNNNREQYVAEIHRMQGLIKDIAALLNTVQTQEVRNREEATRKFVSVREQVKGVRNSQKVVNQYYQNMMRRGNVSPQFFDNKK